MAGWIVLGVLILSVLWVILAYNSLVTLRNQVQNAWRQIDVQLKRRHDLIPNLVNAVRGAMEFERETLERVVEARAKGGLFADLFSTHPPIEKRIERLKRMAYVYTARP